MKLRSESSVAEKLVCKSNSLDHGLTEDQKLSSQLDRKTIQTNKIFLPEFPARHIQTNPCDYVTNFNFLSLDEKSNMTESKINDFGSESDCNTSLPYFDCDNVSVYSLESCSLKSDCTNETFTDTCYYSSITRPVKRRKNYSFSDTDFYDLGNKSNFDSLTSGTSIESNLNVDNNVRHRICMVLYCVVSIFLILLFLGLISLSVLNVCKSQNELAINLSYVEGNLTKCLIGHESAIPVIMDAFRIFNVESEPIHFMWWVGPVGVGKSFSKLIIESSLSSTVNKISLIGSLLPIEISAIEEEATLVFQNLDICRPNLIFVDDLDNEEDNIVTFLSLFLAHVRRGTEISYQGMPMKVFVIVIGTHSSNIVMQYYIDHVAKMSGTRHTLDYKELQSKLYSAAPVEWTNHPITFTSVPFLPLESIHLQKCAINQLNYIFKGSAWKCFSNIDPLLEKFVQTKNLTILEIQDEVFKHYKILPVGDVILLGCKRIHMFVSSLLFEDTSQ